MNTSVGIARVTLADGESYRLRYDFNAICEYEGATGRSIANLTDGAFGARDIRALLWAGLLHEHPRMTLQKAGALMPIDELEELTRACVTAIRQAFGKPEDTEAEADAAGGAAGEAGSPGTVS